MADNSRAAEPQDGGAPFRIRMPGFIVENEVGLGDVIKRVTYAAGITPCAGCKERAQALNRRIVFTSRARTRT